MEISFLVSLDDDPGVSYRRVVRWPGDEDPLVSQAVGGVQAEQDITGQLFIQRRKQKSIIVFLPAASGRFGEA